MSLKQMKKEDFLGREPKHITYVRAQDGSNHDMLWIKEVLHFKDGTKVPNQRRVMDYQRPFWVTLEGRRTHRDKKDYEYTSNLRKYSCTQLELPRRIAKVLNDYSSGPNPPLKRLARSPYLYGVDVTTPCLYKAEMREKYGKLMSFNTVAGSDIETNVHSADGEIICQSVTCKDKAVLVYLRSWIDDVEDPVGETQRVAQEHIGGVLAARGINLEVLIVDTPAEVVRTCARYMHKWQPDFVTFWNIDFDMTEMEKTLVNEGIEPKSVFCDENIPPAFQYFDYRRGPSQKTTASGKTMSINIEDRWNWVTHAASFQFIDSLPVYRLLRLTDGKDSSYRLDDILDKELSFTHSCEVTTPNDIETFLKETDERLQSSPGATPKYTLNKTHVARDDLRGAQVGDTLSLSADFGKLKFEETAHLTGLRWHEVMQKQYKIKYGVYNVYDSITLEMLDEKTNDLASKITTSSKHSDYKNFNSNPKRLCDDMHFWYLNREPSCVIGSSSDDPVDEFDQHVIGHDDWIVTLPSYMAAPDGLTCVKEFPDYKTLIFAHVADLDIVSTYPNVSQLLNISRETCLMEFSRMQGITEHHRREVGVNLTGGRTNAVEICEKILAAPSLDSLLKDFQGEIGLTVEPVIKDLADEIEPRYERREPTEVVDDEILEDVPLALPKNVST